jgi:two-component system response regulator QseB
MRILVAEDNELLGEALVTALKQENYAVDWVRTGPHALSAPQVEHFDAIILDLGLPGQDGLSVLKDLRAKKILTPVLILTARDSLDTKVEGLDSGADDFLTKPFERAELMARLRSLLRRQRLGDHADSQIVYGDILIDTANLLVFYHNNTVMLSRKEFALLSLLLERPGKVFTREELQQSLYSWDDDVSSNTLEVHVHNLRKKFYPELIRTLRGIGYRAEQHPPIIDSSAALKPA